MEHLNCRTVQENSAQLSKKVLLYIYGIRLWYLVCPLVAFIFGYYNLTSVLHLYEGALILFAAICIYSQFFSSASWGFDLEQHRLKKETEAEAKRTYGKFYTSPLALCLPCIIVIGLIELPKLISYIFAVF